MTQKPPTRGPRTVRARLLTLLAVPLAALLALWGYTAATAVQGYGAERRAQAEAEVRGPLLDAVHALQDERRAAAGHLGRPGGEPAAALEPAAERTRQAAAELDPEHAGLPAQLMRALEGPREAVATGSAEWPEVYTAYTAAIDSALHAAGAPAVRGPAPELSWSAEQLARQDALLLAAWRSAAFEPEQYRDFSAAADGRRALEAVTAAGLDGTALELWDALAESPQQRALAAVERQVGQAGPGATAAEAAVAGWDAWQDGYPPLRDGLRDVERAADTAAAAEHAGPAALLTAPAGLAVLLGLAAICAAVALSVRTGRALLAELAGLRGGALDIARRKLPQALRRIRSGGSVDIAAEAPEHPEAHDEFSQVHQALGVVHRAALRAATERAELSDGVSLAFVNLARRSQLLVNRQLELLDDMERRTEDPAALEELFRLDHLSTRMRRQAESLIILSGAEPARSWSGPVPMTSVVQAAVCEIEDYRRIELHRLPNVSLSGHAVADLTHLLAELLENATRFSPPHTWVRVTGSRTADGYRYEIEDAGPGLEQPELDRGNLRIRQSDSLDLGETDRLGLFVVGRLAGRHRITVELRANEAAGTTASVLVPGDLLTIGAPGWDAAPGAAGVPGMTGAASSA